MVSLARFVKIAQRMRGAQEQLPSRHLWFLVFFLSFLILLLDLKQQTIGSWEDEDTMVLLCQEWRYKQEPIHWSRSYPCDIAWW